MFKMQAKWLRLCTAVEEQDWQTTQLEASEILLQVRRGVEPPKVIPISNPEIQKSLATTVCRKLMRLASKRGEIRESLERTLRKCDPEDLRRADELRARFPDL